MRFLNLFFTSILLTQLTLTAQNIQSENWQQKLNNPEEHKGATEIKDGWITLRDQNKRVSCPVSEPIINGAIRAEYMWPESGSAGDINLRNARTGYSARRTSNKIELTYDTFVEEKYTPTVVASFDVPKPNPGDKYTIELRIEERNITIKLDNKSVINIKDEKFRITDTNIPLQPKLYISNAPVRNIEVLSIAFPKTATSSNKLPVPVAPESTPPTAIIQSKSNNTNIINSTPQDLDKLVKIQTPIFAQNPGIKIKTFSNAAESLKKSRVLTNRVGYVFIDNNTTLTVEQEQGNPYLHISGTHYSGASMEFGTLKPVKQPTIITITANVRITALKYTPPAQYGKLLFYTRARQEGSSSSMPGTSISKMNDNWTPITFTAQVMPQTKGITFAVGFEHVDATIDIKDIQVSNNP